MAMTTPSLHAGLAPVTNSFHSNIPISPSQPSGFITSRDPPVAQVTPVPASRSTRGYFGRPDQKSFAFDQDQDVESLEREWNNLYAQVVSASRQPEDWEHATLPQSGISGDKSRNTTAHVPDYVFEYAPLVHLFSGEQYWPGDMIEHLEHITVTANYTPLEDDWQHLTLDNLDSLNQFENGEWSFLTSNDDVETNPEWMLGKKHIPKNTATYNTHFPFIASWTEGLSLGALETLRLCVSGVSRWLRGAIWSFYSDPRGVYRPASDHVHSQDDPRFHPGRSSAPAVLLTVDKGHGIVDAFWFFFYSFNQGNGVFSVRFGHHLGDWEHCAIRFHHGKPKAVFFSEHEFGNAAYTYEAVEKVGKRPVIYSAVGTHAMYPTPGTHPYILPFGILKDQTDRGPLWDPAMNAYTYTYDISRDILHPSDTTPQAPVGWFHFAGRWGDKIYAANDKRQYSLFSEHHYVSGPLGPKFKNLGRKTICENDARECAIKTWLAYIG